MFLLLSKFIGDLRNEFRGYNSQSFLKDLMAGITVAAVALPLSLAFGVSGGADAAAGLITAILSGFIMSFTSGASYQISGPTGAMTAILITIVSRYSLQGMFLACLLAGIILLLYGIFKIGKLVELIPTPVIIGFTSGISVVIAFGQIDNVFGTVSKGENIVEKIVYYFQNGFSPSIPCLSIGLLVIAIMLIWPKKWNAKVPSSLVAIVAAGLICILLQLDIATVGEIPKTMIHQVRLNVSAINLKDTLNLLSPALTIATLCMIESLLCASSASRMKSEKFDADRELISQGIGNIIIPFFGGVPSTSAIARTSVAIKSGGQTRLTGVLHSFFLLACMFILAPAMAVLPLSALGGVLMVTAWRMNEWDKIKFIFSKKLKGAILKFTVTMLTTILFDLTIAILVGVLVSLLVFVLNVSKLQISFSKIMNDPHDQYNDCGVLYITGPVFFANSAKLIKSLEEHSDCKKLILSMRGVPLMDITCADALMDFYNQNKSEDFQLFFCGVQDNVMENFRRLGFNREIGEDHFYWSVDSFLSSSEAVYS